MAPRGVRDAAVEGWLAGGGEMGALMRSFDWSRTVLGPVSGWPTSLKTMAGVVLNNRFPMLIWWGPELIQAVYNDAYRPILGNKHPASLGAPGPEGGAEIWDVIGSMARGVLDGGPATWSEHLLLWMQRRGFVEETYFTFSYSPVPDDDGHVGGVLITAHETTEQIQDDRQLRMLRDLAAHASDATSAEEACRTAATIFASNGADLPFVLLYLADGREGEARLVGESGLAGYEGPAKPAAIPLRGERARATWPLAAAARAGREVLVDDLAARFGALPGGRWGSPPVRAIVLPLIRPGQPEPYGFLVAGVSPHRLLDERYCGLFRLAAAQVVTTIGLVARVALHLQLAELRHRAVREREKMYALFMQAPVAIASLRGPQHVFELANPHYETMVGKTNLAGRAYVDVFPELADHPIISILDRVYTTGVPYVTDELRIDIDRGSGLVEESHFSFNLFPVRGEFKEPEGFLCVAVDVTERVRARKRLEEAMQEREELLVREQEARHQAESANRSKDEFLAMLGHELRNPLAPIMTALYLMRMRAGDVAA
ncbi:MAG TPA: PAS domain-containing protein, partial [Polyangium sp.]|nr:PAS domain-containing protein [Polyangium sp.]